MGLFKKSKEEKTEKLWEKAFGLKQLGRHEEAIVCCDKALELDPNDALALEEKESLSAKL